MGRLIRAAAALGVAAAAVLAWAAPASAHAQLVGAEPGPGQHLDRPPVQVLLRFSERVYPLDDGIRLIDSRGVRFGSAQPITPPGHPEQVSLAVPADLPDGYYTVAWRVTSADSHPVNGAFAFAVGSATIDPAAAAGAALETRTDVDGTVVGAYWAVRWLGYAALVLLLGGVTFLVVCWPNGWVASGARRTVWAGWYGSLGGAVGALLLQGPYASGSSLAGVVDPDLIGATLRSRYGMAVLIRMALLLVALTVLLRRPRRPSTWELVGLAALGLALPATWVGTGHAGAGPWFQAITDTAHLTMVSVWLGGLAVLAGTALPRRSGVPVGELAEAVPRFSRTAQIAVAVLVVTGVTQAWLELGSVSALTGSAYGELLFVKVAAFGVLLCLGAVSRSIVRSRYLTADERPAKAAREARDLARLKLRRSVQVESAIAVGILAVTAALVATPPGTHHDSVAAPPVAGPAAPAPALSTVVEKEIALSGGGRVVVRAEPARVGDVRVSVSVRSAEGGSWDVPEVTARLSHTAPDLGPLRMSFSRTGAGEFQSTVVVPSPGTWQLLLLVRTSEVDQSEAVTDLQVS